LSSRLSSRDRSYRGALTEHLPCAKPGRRSSMLTKEENELLTSVGPGTPCGNLLRRYWQPACFANDLTDEHPTRRVKIMHEELVFFRDKSGNYGCVGEHCPHRGASLAYGFVED